MSAAAASEPPRREEDVPFGHASPAEIKAALTPEDAAEFELHWREVLASAADRLDLTPVHEMLEAWRRVAWMTTVRGHDGHRRLTAAGDERLRTGALPAGNSSWQDFKAQRGL